MKNEFWYLRNVIIEKFKDEIIFLKNKFSFLMLEKASLFLNEKNKSIFVEIQIDGKVVNCIKEFDLSEHSLFERVYLLKDFLNKTEIYFNSQRKVKKNYILDFWKDGSKTKNYPKHFMNYIDYYSEIIKN